MTSAAPRGVGSKAPLIALAVLLVAIAGFIAWTDSQVVTEADIATDALALQSTYQQLDEVGRILDGIELQQVESRPARRKGCTIDSGDLFQPRTNRTWQSPPGAADRVEAEVRAGLVNRGWILPPPGTSSRLSWRSPDGWEAQAVIFRTEAAALVEIEATIVGAAPCRLR
jgi:hypothetical protein